jgi:hypothetical protein
VFGPCGLQAKSCTCKQWTGCFLRAYCKVSSADRISNPGKSPNSGHIPIPNPSGGFPGWARSPPHTKCGQQRVVQQQGRTSGAADDDVLVDSCLLHATATKPAPSTPSQKLRALSRLGRGQKRAQTGGSPPGPETHHRPDRALDHTCVWCGVQTVDFSKITSVAVIGD